MHFNFKVLPALIALAVLVAVFAAISRQRTKERVNLWLAGWALILLRSVVEFMRFKVHWLSKLELAIGLCALEMASVAFVVSVAPQAKTWRRQLVLFLVLGVSAGSYTIAMLCDVSDSRFYYAVVLLALVAALSLLWIWYRRVTVYVVCISLACAGLTALLMWAIAVGKQDYGVHFVLGALTLFAGGLYWYRFRRPSAGVLTTVFGFAAWGLSFPSGILLATMNASVRVESEVWNIPKYLVAVGMIVTLLEEQIRESEHLAYHDALTGLPNRRLLRDRLLQAFARADRVGHKVAVLLLDLDDFKEVNDNFGHRVGDAALQQVAVRLSSRLRATDTLARTGGDEFTVVSEVVSVQGAQTLASALESALLVPISVEGALVRTGVSVGFALYPEDGTDLIDLCAAADKAMYASKRGIRSL